MQSIQIRPFERSDREQLTALVNTHIGAVVPGVSVSVNVLMSQLEREPAEAIVDPWVVERRTLVAVERDAVVAGAHLLRYGSDEQVGESYRNAAEIRWLVFAPAATEAADALLAASIATLDAWQPSRQYADGSLPALGCYGVPAAWPHLRDAYVRAGFDFVGRVEIILVSQVDDLPELGEPPLLGLTIQREVGQFGTQFTALLDGERVGLVDVDVDQTAGGTRSRFAGWSDIGNLYVAEEHRRKHIGTWLLANAGSWLRLGRVDRLVDYAWPEQHDLLGFLGATGFQELTRTERGWVRT
ncbi:MAG TPA: GNAT family N-acetyltransferase [Gaiellaceae bacterium]